MKDAATSQVSRTGPGAPRDLVLATLIPLVAFALQWHFWTAIQPFVWFLFYPAVFFSSRVDGLRGGMVATILSTVLVWYFFVPPQFSFAVHDPMVFLTMGVFFGMGVLFSLNHEQLRAMNLRVKHELRERNSLLTVAGLLARFGGWSVNLADGRVIWSDEVAAIHEKPHGFSPTVEEGINFYAPESRERIATVFGACARDGMPYDEELEIITAHGKRRWVRTVGEAVRNDAGKIVEIRGALQDITERKQAEAALQKSEVEFHALAEAMPQIVWVTRPDGWNIYFNQQWMDYTGLTLEESYGHGWNKPFHPDDQKRAWDAWQNATTNLATYSLECRLRRADGAYRWWLIRGVPMRDAAGKILKWFGTCTDIHEFKQTALAMSESEAQYRGLFETSPVAICVTEVICDTEGRPNNFRFLRVNPALERFVRAKAADIVGRTVYEFAKQVDPTVVERIGRVALTGVPDRLEAFSAQVNTLYEATMYSPLRGQCVVFAVDITERKRVQMAEREEQERFRTLVETAPMAVFIQTNGCFAYVNAAALRLFGATQPPDLLGQPVLSRVHPEYHARTRERIKLLNDRRQRAEPGDMIFLALDGTNRDVITSGVPFEYQNQHGALVFALDITERKRAETSLEQTRQTLVEAQRIAHLGSFEYIAATQATVWSEEEYRIYGLDSSEPSPAYDQMLAKNIHPDDAALLHETFSKAMQHGSIYELEHRIVRPDGSVRWVLDRALPYFDSAGKLVRYVGTTLDITERKQTEQALRVNEERYRSLVETSFDWVWEVDAQGRYTYASPRVRDLLGYLPEEVVGRTPFDFMEEAEAQRVRNIFEKIAAARQPILAVENLNRHKDGRLVVVETNALPVFASDGGWLGYRGMDRDITARRVAEKALVLRSAALEAAANAIVITDLKGSIEWANPAFTALSGWGLTEALGKNSRDLVKSGKHDAAFYRQIWDTILAGKVWQGEIINRRRDGELRTENMTITPVRDAQGVISHFIAIKQDITNQKAVEEHLFQTQRIEAIGTLASGVAHDLNNILSPILLVADLLKDAQDDEHNREMLAMVRSSAARGSEIVKQLLTFSRGQKGERVPVQLRHLIKEIMMVVRETFPREIECHQNLGKDLWTILADPTQIHQVLLNLCVNARDAMPNGGRLTLDATNVTLVEGAPALAPGAHPGPYLAIGVRDTGHGIPAEIRHRIFDPFYTTKPLGAGTGLGLSTVLGVVQNHGGFIRVDSAPNQGTTFTVYLPAWAEGALARATEAAAPMASAAPAPSAHTILVVDDEPSIIRAITLLLEREGHRVITAVNGQDALVQYIQNRAQVHLVLSDLMMPLMNGIDLVRALRALDPKLAIIVTSGMVEVVLTEALNELGVGVVLKKPCEPGILLAAVRQRLTPS